MADLMHPDGRVTTHVPKNPPEWTLPELQFLVGGYIEQATDAAGRRVNAFCDEDGLAKELKVNAKASTTIGRGYVGPVLFISDDERIQ